MSADLQHVRHSMRASAPKRSHGKGRKRFRLAPALRALYESLEARKLLSVTVNNASFESPNLGGFRGSGATYQYDPTNASWTFFGNAGIEHNGSAWNAPNAPNGQQAAFLQSNVTTGQLAIGAISQSLNFTATGTYNVTFYAAQRVNKGVLPIEFLVDGTQVGSTVSPASNSAFTQYTTASFTISTTGSHTIEFTGVDSTTNDDDSFIDQVGVNAVASPPTVATPAAASPSPVTTGTTTALSVLGADVSGESTLTYTWATTGTPPATVTYSTNGTNASKNTTATFTAAGTYNFTVTIADNSGGTVTSSVSVVVDQNLTAISVTPTTATVIPSQSTQLAAVGLDQFGAAMTSQPSFTWHDTGNGTVSTAGLFTASATTGTATITAAASGITSNGAVISVVPESTPTVATAAAATPSPVTGVTTALSVLGSDVAGESTLTYTWSVTGTPPAPVTFSNNGTNGSKNTTAIFAAAGTYNFLATIVNGSAMSTTSSVSVTVSQTLTSITVTPGSASVAASGTQQYTATGRDQFGNLLSTQPTYTWSSTGEAGTSGSTSIGSINSSSGLFTASSTPGVGSVAATAGSVYGTAQVSVGGASIVGGSATLSTLGTNGYYAADTNSCAIATDNLWTDTKTGYQFAAYYDPAGDIMIGRRLVGSPSWQVFASGITDPTISDDHDVISIAVDSAGYMHVSWGMHNISLNYAISNQVVNGPSLTSLSFTIQTATNAPTLFPDSGATTNEVTYPQFYSIPNSSNLLFAYRNGGAGGGSGNGNEYIDIYNPSTKTWTNNFMINGELTSVNAYLNRMVFDSNGNLLSTWTWRATPSWQTNSNIMYAQSPDDGVTWYQQGGTTQYALPIIQSGTPAASVAQVVENIPQNSSFINQSSMTVDQNNNPIVASYMAPGYNTVTSSGNPNLQYMVWYYYNGQWNSSQVTSRTSDTAIDTSAADVRDLGRPIVLVDKEGRVLVVTRSEDTSQGSFSSPNTPNNDIVIYYCTNLDTASPTWKSVTLNTTNLGEYEPTYDQNLWTANNELSLFFEPVGLSGQTSATVQTLDWNEQAYFDSIGPTVATAASASATQVSGTNVKLSVLGADNAGQASLNYTWALTGSPPAAVAFSDNGDNAAQNATATFSKAGSYTFQATISDSSGLTATSSVTVTVLQTATSVTVTPLSGTALVIGQTQQFQASVTDQFGNSISSPSLSWAATGGSVNSSGLFTAGQSAGAFSVTATSGSATGTATGAVALPAWLGAGSVATWSPASGILNVTGPTSIIADPGTAEPTIEATGTNAVVTLDPTSGIDIHLGGLSLTGGAAADVTSLGTSRTLTNYHLLVIGAPGATAAPLYYVDSTSTLDLADNDMAILYGTGISPLGTVNTELLAAYDGGAWDKPGLTSSVAAKMKGVTALGFGEASALGVTTFDGLTLGGNAVLVKYTLAGDTNLDGSVDGSDYNTVLANFDTSATWTSGSLDYSGSVGGTDYQFVLSEYDENLAAVLGGGASPAKVAAPAAASSSLSTASSSSNSTPATSHTKPTKPKKTAKRLPHSAHIAGYSKSL